MLRISPAGAGFVASKEALYLFSYRDSVGVWTLGGGRTTAAGAGVIGPGMKITLAEGCQMLLADLSRKYGPRVERAIKRRLTQNVFDGFVSFDYNTGAILNGTVDDKWNAGNEAGAIAVLHQYVNAGGKRLNGLVTRRAEEGKIILDGQYPSVLVLVKVSAGDPGRRVQASSLPWTPETDAGMTVTPNTIAPATPQPVAPLPPIPAPDTVWARFNRWWTSL